MQFVERKLENHFEKLNKGIYNLIKKGKNINNYPICLKFLKI